MHVVEEQGDRLATDQPPEERADRVLGAVALLSRLRARPLVGEAGDGPEDRRQLGERAQHMGFEASEIVGRSARRQ